MSTVTLCDVCKTEVIETQSFFDVDLTTEIDVVVSVDSEFDLCQTCIDTALAMAVKSRENKDNE